MEDKKLKILKKAKELFLIYGVKKTTVDEIAKAAEVGKGTIYLYFSSKGDIVSDLAIKEANNIAASLIKAISKETNPEKKLRIFIKSFILDCYDFVNSNIHAADIFDAITKYRSKCKVDNIHNKVKVDNITKIVSNILLEGKEDNSFYFENTLELIENISFALLSYFPPNSTLMDRDNLDKKSDYIIELIINNLKK